MTTAYTTLLGLALPAEGELDGSWGDIVNNSITSLVDSAIAGTTTITATTTLSSTTGATNTSRQAILLCSPASANIIVTAPAQSKVYTVINTSSTYTVTVKASATTGVVLAASEKAVVAWNGSDFVKISSLSGASTFTDITVTGNTSLGDADTDTITQAAAYVTGTQLKSAKTAGNTLSLSAYNTTASAYSNLATLTVGTAPTLALASVGLGSVNNFAIGTTTASTGAFTTVSASGVISSTVASGTAPFSVLSTTQVANLNVALAGNITGTAAIANGGTGLTTAPTNGQLLIGNGTGYTLAALTAGANITVTNSAGGISIASTAGTGTVTSVGQTFTGGIISAGASPVTTSGSLALTVAGTSGGIPYFSSGTAWASSAALAANALVVGGGAGAAPATVTTGTGVVTALGVNTGSSGAVVTQGGAILTTTTVNDTGGTGYTIGYRQMPQNNQAGAGAYTLLLTDDGKHIYLTGGTTNTLTVPTNTAVAFPIGTVVSVVNNNGGACTINGPTNGLQLASGVLASSRTLATKGMAAMLKVGTDLWYVSGPGVS